MEDIDTAFDLFGNVRYWNTFMINDYQHGIDVLSF